MHKVIELNNPSPQAVENVVRLLCKFASEKAKAKAIEAVKKERTPC